MPVIEHYYFPDGYDADNTQWVCVRNNGSSCRANLSDDFDIGAVKMIRKSRAELDTSLLAAPW